MRIPADRQACSEVHDGSSSDIEAVVAANVSEEVKPLTIGHPCAGECPGVVDKEQVPLAVVDPREYWRRVCRFYVSSSAVIVGNILEWYDWTVYAYVEDLLREVFWKKNDRAAWLVFAIPFLARPIGSLLFGWVADTCGRALSLKLAVWGMTIATVAQGCLLPSNDFSLGVLMVLRIVSGLSAGGESAGVNTYISEAGVADRDHTLVAAIGVNNVSGSMAFFVAAVASCVVHRLPKVQQLEWGWRMPFLAAAPLGIVSAMLRKKLPETEAFETMKAASEVKESVAEYPHEGKALQAELKVVALVTIVLAAVVNCNYLSVYLVGWLRDHAGFSATAALSIAAMSKVVQLLMTFPVCFAGDRYGPTFIMLIGGTLTASSVVPALLLVHEFGALNTKNFPSGQAHLSTYVTAAFTLGLWLPLVISIYLVPAMLFVTSLFPTRHRGRGGGMAYGLAACIGGTFPIIATILAEKNRTLPAVYLTLLCGPSLALLSWSRRAQRQGRLQVYQRDWLF